MAKAQPKTRERRSAEELQRASLAVQYELVTLAQTHYLLQKLGAEWKSNPRKKAMSNALLHAFLLATRSLLAFLYSHKPRQSDIIAEDFFDDPKEWQRKPLVPPQTHSGLAQGWSSPRTARS